MLSPRRSFLIASATALLVAVSACSSDTSSTSESDTATTLDTTTPINVVATYSAIGDVVSRLVGDAATVTVLIPNGQDQHDF